MTLARQSY